MNDVIRLQADLGTSLKKAREDAGLSIKELAAKAGRVRDVIYRLEAGKDVSVASLFAVLSVLQMTLRVERAGLPTLEDVQTRFGADEEE
ncbi:helix-turn-helix domain-containing protein [Roseateles saccharophilus]|uniref:Helix-turn-helix protein n=1 Tax=Roseateles saccharophilus TaxID=304 RepID=A0A4R3U6S2_ROSSA|nr:helix-turn-helix transcriptional regulator [Roseateles saccharophilus]TCU83421.1 helix-turn-helix protein [Roseateles saccharophilus]